MDQISLAEYEQNIVMHRSRVLQVADEIKALLATDLPDFVERELKRAFVSNPEFGSTVDDATLKQLKSDVAKTAPAAAQAVIASLADETLWFPADMDDERDRKSIEDNAALWAAVSRIGEAVSELKQTYGFPDAGEPVDYPPPKRFIGGRYLPSLTERYWRHLGELASAQSGADAIRNTQSKTELSRRWEQS